MNNSVYVYMPHATAVPPLSPPPPSPHEKYPVRYFEQIYDLCIGSHWAKGPVY